MTPRLTFYLALLGVAAAGAPLLWLTRPALPPASAGVTLSAATPAQAGSPAVGEQVAVYARVQFTGTPQVLRLSARGVCLAELLPQELHQLPEPGVWEPELMLPAPLRFLELEVQAQWAGSESPQAVTVTLEPPRLPARQMTLWSLPGGILADCCTLEW